MTLLSYDLLLVGSYLVFGIWNAVGAAGRINSLTKVDPYYWIVVLCSFFTMQFALVYLIPIPVAVKSNEELAVIGAHACYILGVIAQHQADNVLFKGWRGYVATHILAVALFTTGLVFIKMLFSSTGDRFAFALGASTALGMAASAVEARLGMALLEAAAVEDKRDS